MVCCKRRRPGRFFGRGPGSPKENLDPGQKIAGMTAFFFFSFLLFFSAFPLYAKARRPSPEKTVESYSVSEGKPIPIAAKKTRLPLVIFGESPGASSTYVPSGFMGDEEAMKVKTADFSAPLTSSKTGTGCLVVEIKAQGREGWAGLYWQTPANNWGKIKGAGYDLSAAKRLTFWARGEKGGEKITQVKMGGLIGPYPDTDEASIGPLRLNKEWTQYVIDLTGKDLRHIVGGFAFSVRRSDNPRGAVFYLDEIIYEGDPASTTAAAPEPEPLPAPSVAKLAKPVRLVVPYAGSNGTFDQDGLDEIAAVAVKAPDAQVLVEGHTDNVGPKQLNKKLSLERAKAVADYLVSKGVARDRITVAGLGDDHPVREGSNDTAQGRMENRRVEVTLVPK